MIVFLHEVYVAARLGVRRKRLVICDVLTYNEIEPDRGQTRYADYPAGALDPATQPAFEAHVHEHPLVTHYRASGSGEPVMISDFLSQQRFHRLGGGTG